MVLVDDFGYAGLFRPTYLNGSAQAAEDIWRTHISLDDLVAMGFADVNNDTRLDFISVIRNPDTTTSVFANLHNTPSPPFSAPGRKLVQFGSMTYDNPRVTVDFLELTGDGRLDLVISDMTSTTDVIGVAMYRALPGGGFSEEPIPLVEHLEYDDFILARFFDFDRDGRMDLLGLDSNTNYLYYLTGNGLFNFTYQFSHYFPGYPTEVWQVNLYPGDRCPGLVFWGGSGPMTVRVNNCTAGYWDAAYDFTTATANSGFAIMGSIANVSSANGTDLVAATSCSTVGVYRWLPGLSDFGLVYSLDLGVGNCIRGSSQFFDANGDMRSDFVVANERNVFLLMANASGQYTTAPAMFILIGGMPPVYSYPLFTVDTGDADGDGLQDIWMPLLGMLYTNQGAGNFTAGRRVGLTATSYEEQDHTIYYSRHRIRDIDADGRADLVMITSAHGSNEEGFLVQAFSVASTGARATFSPNTITLKANLPDLTAAFFVDPNGDGRIDFVYSRGGYVGDFGSSTPTNCTLWWLPNLGTVASFGATPILLARNTTTYADFFPPSGSPPPPAADSCGLGGVLTADVTGDGIQDLVFMSQLRFGSLQPYVLYLRTGNRTLPASVNYTAQATILAGSLSGIVDLSTLVVKALNWTHPGTTGPPRGRGVDLLVSYHISGSGARMDTALGFNRWGNGSFPPFDRYWRLSDNWLALPNTNAFTLIEDSYDVAVADMDYEQDGIPDIVLSSADAVGYFKGRPNTATVQFPASFTSAPVMLWQRHKTSGTLEHIGPHYMTVLPRTPQTPAAVFGLAGSWGGSVVVVRDKGAAEFGWFEPPQYVGEIDADYFQCRAMATLDVDGDSYLDVFISTRAGMFWARNTGDLATAALQSVGPFARSWTVDNGGNRPDVLARVVVPGDINGDGALDLVYIDYGEYNNNGAELGWIEATQLLDSSDRSGPTIIANRFGAKHALISVPYAGIYSRERRFPLLARSVYATDLDASGSTDIVAGLPRNATLVLFMNTDGRGTLVRRQISLQPANGFLVQDVVMVQWFMLRDLNGDGVVDVVWGPTAAEASDFSYSPSSESSGDTEDADSGVHARSDAEPRPEPSARTVEEEEAIYSRYLLIGNNMPADLLLWRGTRAGGSWNVTGGAVSAGVAFESGYQTTDTDDLYTYGQVYAGAACDITGDGRPDLITSHYSAGMIWQQNLSNSTALAFGPPRVLGDRLDVPASIECVDIEGSGVADDLLTLAGEIQNPSYSHASSYKSKARSSLLQRVTVGPSLAPQYAAVSGRAPLPIETATQRYYSVLQALMHDFNGDGLPDMLGVLSFGENRAGEYSTSSSTSMYDIPTPLVVALQSSVRVPLPRPARSITVDTAGCGWSAVCIARAVAEASSCTGDTVLVPAGTYGQCFAGLPYQIDKSVTIRAVGGPVVIDCARGAGPAAAGGRYGFEVVGATSVTLQGITIRSAVTAVTDFGGAALRVTGSGALLTLVDSAVINCTAVRGDDVSVRAPQLGFGPAVVVDSGSLVAIRSRFENNTATNAGGAIAVIGSAATLSFTDCVFAGNRAAGSGGAVFLELTARSTFLVLNHTAFERNVADGSADPAAAGGAIAVVLQNGGFGIDARGGVSTFFGNAAAGAGGGLYVAARASNVTVSVGVGAALRFEANAASGGAGGGVAVTLAQAATVAIVSAGAGLQLIGNTAVLDGGGLAITGLGAGSPAQQISFAGAGAFGTVSGNLAGRDGGGVALALPAGLITGTLSGGTFAGNMARRAGGGLLVAGPSGLTLSTCTLRNNTALWGGGLAALPSVAYQATVPTTASPAALAASPGTAASCAALPTITLSGCNFAVAGPAGANYATGYGRSVFTCETRLLLTAVVPMPPAGDFGVGAVPTAGGFAFVCRASVAALSCPSATALAVPWLTLDAATAAAAAPWFAATGTGATSGYGAFAAGPALSVNWVERPPAELPSGLPLSEVGTASLSALDTLGQSVLDPGVSTVASLGAAGSVPMAEFVLLAGGGTVPLTKAVLALDALAIAARGTAGIGQTVELRFQISSGLGEVTATAGTASSTLITITQCPPATGLRDRTGQDEVYLQCDVCPLKQFSNVSSLAPCTPCAGTSFNPTAGATECLSCPDGTAAVAFYTDARGRPAVNCTCKPEYWQPQRTDGLACAPCPEGAVCAGGMALPTASPGYFPTTDPGVFLPCPNVGACAGGAPFKCAPAYEGRLCALCRQGYYMLNQRCLKCNTTWVVPIILLFIILFFALVFLLVGINLKTDVNYRFAAVVIGLTSLQISSMYGSLEILWPEFARRWFAGIAFLSFNVEVSSPECAARIGDVWLIKWFLTILLPFLFLIPFAVVILVGFLYIRLFLGRRPPPTSEDGKEPNLFLTLTMAMLCDAAKRGYFQLITFLYMPLANMSLSYFRCTKARDGTYVLESSPSRICYQGKYWTIFPIALIFAVVYSFGIPAALVAGLRRARRQAVASNELAMFELKFSFLVGRFKPSFYLFEAGIMGMKLAVVLCMTFFQSAFSKAYSVVFVLVGATLQLGWVKPYVDKYHNVMGIVCLTSCAAILWAGTFSGFTLRAFGVVAGICVNMLAILIGNIYDGRIILRRRKEAEADLDSFFVAVANDDAALGTDPALQSGSMANVATSLRNPVFSADGDGVPLESFRLAASDSSTALVPQYPTQFAPQNPPPRAPPKPGPRPPIAGGELATVHYASGMYGGAGGGSSELSTELYSMNYAVGGTAVMPGSAPLNSATGLGSFLASPASVEDMLMSLPPPPPPPHGAAQ